MAGVESIMVIDDCIAEEGLDKMCSTLVKLAISGHHRSRSFWMTTQRYTPIPRHVRDQMDTVIMLPLNYRSTFNLIIEENRVSLDMATIIEIKSHLHPEPYGTVIIYPGHKNISLL